MDTLATALVIGFALIFGAFILSRFLGRERTPRPDPMHQPFGDYPHCGGFFHDGSDTI